MKGSKGELHGRSYKSIFMFVYILLIYLHLYDISSFGNRLLTFGEPAKTPAADASGQAQAAPTPRLVEVKQVRLLLSIS